MRGNSGRERTNDNLLSFRMSEKYNDREINEWYNKRNQGDKLDLEGIVMTETMGVAIGIGVFALVFIYLGCLMWKKGKITLLHSYHYDKVSPSDKKVFCKISGWGVIFIGIGLLVTAIIIGITDSALSFIAFALGFAESSLTPIHEKLFRV